MNKFLFGLALAFLLPAISVPAWAGFQEGAEAYNKGDYQLALSEWLPLAQSGDAQAQNAVGALYDNGLGVASDEAEAFRWYSMAADQNYPMAMRNLGTMYATGHGVPYNLQQAQTWLGRAASAGDQVAARRLAGLPPVGTGPADPVVTPLPPLGSTAQQTPPATTGFGANTGPSNFVTQPTPAVAPAAANNQQTAAAAPAPAAAGTTQPAASNEVTFPAPAVSPQPAAPATNVGVSSNSSAQTAAPVQQLGSVQPASTSLTPDPAPDAAPVGGTAADGWRAFDLGDYKTALAIWQPLAQQGDPNLQVLVGSLYDYGQGVTQDKNQALQWYLMAAQKGLGRAQLAAGSLLVKAGKQQNLVEGYKWLTIAGETLRGQAGDIAAGQAISLRKQITKGMSEADISKAEAMARDFHAS